MAPARPGCGSPRTAPVVLRERTDVRAPADSTDPNDPAEPIENADPKDPIEPIESAEPTEPIDRKQPLEPTDRNDASDHGDSPGTVAGYSDERARIARRAIRCLGAQRGLVRRERPKRG
jgi:hypothetical protein